MVELYADLCEIRQRATRENTRDVVLVPTFLRTQVELELEKRGILGELIAEWTQH